MPRDTGSLNNVWQGDTISRKVKDETIIYVVIAD